MKIAGLSELFLSIFFPGFGYFPGTGTTLTGSFAAGSGMPSLSVLSTAAAIISASAPSSSSPT